MNDKFFEVKTRSTDRRGRTLEPGKGYAIADFNPDIVAEWVRTGYASWTGEQTEHEKAPKRGKEK